jgi:hypothetical protein
MTAIFFKQKVFLQYVCLISLFMQKVNTQVRKTKKSSVDFSLRFRWSLKHYIDEICPQLTPENSTDDKNYVECILRKYPLFCALYKLTEPS